MEKERLMQTMFSIDPVVRLYICGLIRPSGNETDVVGIGLEREGR